MKVIVSDLPVKSEDCIFAEYISMTSKYKCMFQSGMYSRCKLDRGETCPYLKRIGDKVSICECERRPHDVKKSTGPSLKDIPISDEIMEEAKRRVHEELNTQLDHFCKLHEGFSIKIPKEKVAPEVLNLIEKMEREEQQRVKFGNHIPLAYYCQRCDAKKNGEATDAYCQKCPYKVQNDKVKIVEISVMSDGSLEPRFVMETEDNFNGKQ